LAAPVPITDTSSSPHAAVRPVGLDEARWTGGFWGERFALCRDRMLPGLWSVMEGTNYSQFYRNFQVAAGVAEGKHRGASFNDGDFYKWIEGACAVLASTRDVELEKRLDEVIGVIAKAQRADGYIQTSVLIRQRRGDADAKLLADRLQFEMYNMGHLLTAACLHYRVTGRTNFLVIARKTADFLDATFANPTPEQAQNSICPSHYMGMIELYRATREPRYLELAKRFLTMRNLVKDGSDDNQDRIPFEQQTNAIGHAVRANYLYAGAADLYAETGDPGLWQPLERIWTNLVTQKLYITGGCGALFDGASPDGAKDQKSITRVHQSYGRNYQLPNTTAHNETCANIGCGMWNWRMFLATGEARFMDVLELELYNSVLSGGSLDGTNFLYVNPLRTTEPMPVALRWQHQRVPFINTFCCPPNLFRTLAEASGYAYSKTADSLWVNLYGSSRVETRLENGRKLRLAQATEYPWNGRISLRMEECGTEPFTLKLRIPGWAAGASVRVNGAQTESAPVSGSYFEIRREWRSGDLVELELPMPARLMEANPLVEENVGQVAVQRGPVVYCLESADLPGGRSVMDVMAPDTMDLVARYDGRLLGGVVVIEGRAFLRAAEAWDGRLYQEARPEGLKPAPVRFVPYYAWGNRGKGEMTVWMNRLMGQPAGK
jgi:DUF1680 family protein